MTQHRRIYRSSRLKFILLIGCVAIAIIAASQWDLAGSVQGACGWVKDFGVFAPLVFVALFNVGTFLFVPGSVLALKGGVLFGLIWGGIYVLIAAILGATLTYGLGRYCCRDWAYRQLQAYPQFRQKLQFLDAAIAREGWKIVLLTRLSPIFPFNLTSYAFGLTQISLKDYLLGSLGILPGAVMYTYIGTVVGELAMPQVPQQLAHAELQMLHWGFRLVGVAATIGITVYLAQISRHALAQAAKQVSSSKTDNPEINP
jgi:uncharacterized membrane protein YdjX (TVP38/TMEM64 family)